MQELLQAGNRRIHLVAGGSMSPAVYYLVDRDVGGVLINAPPFDQDTLERLRRLAPPRFIFLPSHRGAQDLEDWRAAGVEILAWESEAALVPGGVDTPVSPRYKLTRTIDFLPMAGRTPGTCALYLKNKPGVVFFGPILAPDDQGWPTLLPEPDDHSFETRMFGALGIKDLKYEFAFTDRFQPGATRFGPGADQAIAAAVERRLMD